MLYLGVMFLMFHVHFCTSEEFLPQDGVTLRNLRVSDQGMVEVDILIEDFNDLPSRPDLKVVLTNQHSSDNDSFETPLVNVTRLSRTNLVSSTIRGLQQDVKYSIFLQSNKSIISHNYTLVTTGLQAITNIANSEITCEFLPNSRADGYLVEWRPMNLIDGEAGYTTLGRVQNKASIRLRSLIPGTSYQVHGFGLQNGDRLHTFPIMLQGGLMIQSTGTVITRASDVMTESSGSLDTETLVPILSGVLGGIMIFMFVLVCIIVGIVKCPKKSHARMSEDVEKTLSENREEIQTSTNICYGEIVDSSETPTQNKEKRESVKSIHLYDDIVAATAVYENVDPETGLPITPKPVTSSERCLNKFPICERACLPLKGITPPVPLHSSQRSTRKGLSSIGRARTFNHKQCKAPMTQKFATLSVVLEAADYETPIENMKVTAL